MIYLNWVKPALRYINNISHYKKLLKHIPPYFYAAHTYPSYNLVRYKVVDYQDGLFTMYDDPGITLIGIDSQGNQQTIFARPRNNEWVLLSKDYSLDYTSASLYISTKYAQTRGYNWTHAEKKDWYKLLDTYPEKFI